MLQPAKVEARATRTLHEGSLKPRITGLSGRSDSGHTIPKSILIQDSGFLNRGYPVLLGQKKQPANRH